MEKWKSRDMYPHPLNHQIGHVVLSNTGVYGLKTGNSWMSCPQAWAARIHYDEGDSRIGRPKTGDVTLTGITVSAEIKRGLEEKAEELGLTVPDIRRAAYAAFLQSGDQTSHSHRRSRDSSRD